MQKEIAPSQNQTHKPPLISEATIYVTTATPHVLVLLSLSMIYE